MSIPAEQSQTWSLQLGGMTQILASEPYDVLDEFPIPSTENTSTFLVSIR